MQKSEIPESLQERGGSTLQWEVLKERIAGRAQSELGQEIVHALEPSADVKWIDVQQGRTAEMRMLLASGASIELAGIFDVDGLLATARIPGAVLAIEELSLLLTHAERVQAWRMTVLLPPDAKDVWPEIVELSAPLLSHDLEPLLKEFRGKIEADGTISDDASAELRRIRRALGRQHQAIEATLKRALQRFSEDGTVQDALITVRGDRFVIPIKAEAKRRIPGVVHGSSSSGQTVFVEPMETIESNNELARLLQEEQAEIHRILAAMTRTAAVQSIALQAGAQVLAEVDAHAAVARFANDLDCVRPQFTTQRTVQGTQGPETELEQQGEFELVFARHPLLELRLREQEKELIPLTLALPSGKHQMIISGPNTGGKTVALKTMGLLAIMAQAGLPIPAARAKLPVFTAVYADIGDLQSLETNLSTFSAHVTNLDRISRRADEHSLVLLDELGSATDPEEGAALAVAVAQHFLTLKSYSVITTHLTALKVYAAQNREVLNAAVGFDEATLTPTYDLRLGVPGASAGLNVAARLGMAPDIITAARAQMSSQQVDIGRFLDELHAQLTAAAQERVENLETAQKLQRERDFLQQEGRKEQQIRMRELERQLADLIKDFETRLRDTLRAVDDKKVAQRIAKESALRLAQLKREYSEQFQAKIDTLGIPKPNLVKKGSRTSKLEPRAGDLVLLRSLGREGVVVRVIDERTFEVSFGTIKMRVPRSDIAELTPVHESTIPGSRKQGGGVHVGISGNESFSTELNVIGKSADEAESEVDRYVEQAFLAGLPQVRIVHGVGMGVLRRTLRDYLRKHPHVTGVEEPAHNQGGQGVTVVSLRQ